MANVTAPYPPTEKLRQIGVSLTARQIRWLEQHALAEGLRRSDIVRRALELAIRLEETAR